MTYRIHVPAEVAGDYPELVAAVMAADMNLDDGDIVTVTDPATGERWRVTVDHVLGTYTESVNPDPFVMWQAVCLSCGAATFTDEWTGGEPYYPGGCVECGSMDRGPWTVADEPHPAVWSVWVGGVEMNDHYMTETQAAQLADVYRMDGYDDVTVSARS